METVAKTFSKSDSKRDVRKLLTHAQRRGENENIDVSPGPKTF